MTSRPRRRRVEPTDEWEQIELLCGWPEQRLFALDALGEGGWLKALKLRGCVARGPRRPPGLQQALFAYVETP